MTTADLAKALAELGQPILASGITRIEKGQRRVDSDDLVALALALDVSPNALLLSSTSDGEVALTPALTMATSQVWRWATGEAALPAVHDDGLQFSSEETAARQSRFRHENRPYEAGQHSTMRRIVENPELFAQLRDIAVKAHVARVPMVALGIYLEWLDQLNMLDDYAQHAATSEEVDAIDRLKEKMLAVATGDTGEQRLSEVYREMDDLQSQLARGVEKYRKQSAADGR